MKYIRVYNKVPRKPGVQRVRWFDPVTKANISRPGIKSFRARREVVEGSGFVKTKEAWFYTVEEAWLWKTNPECPVERNESFGDWVEKFLADNAHVHQPTTVVRYEDLMNRYLKTSALWNVPIANVSKRAVHEWLQSLVLSKVTVKRKSFHHELDLVRAVLNHWGNVSGVPMFKFGDLYIRCAIKKEKKKNRRKITLVELQQFLEVLRDDKHADVLVPLVAILFFCALRVSEAVALTSKDLILNHREPHRSFIKVNKAVKYPRRKGAEPYVNHYKNAEFEGEEKVLPIVPDLYKILIEFGIDKHDGLLLTRASEPNEYMKYKFIQYRLHKYLKAFGWDKDVTSTHFCRHGGATWFYNLSGDKRVAGQMLGDKSDAVIDGYIKETDQRAKDFVHQLWTEKTAEPVPDI